MTSFSTNIESLSPRQQQVLALAGMVQAVALVHEIAQTGQYDHDSALVCLQSLFITQPDTFAHVFATTNADEDTAITESLTIQAISNLQLGLNTLEKLLQQDKQTAVVELTRYLIGIMHLQRKLVKKPQMMDALSKQLDITAGQVSYFGIEHENVSASIAEVYTKHLSQLGYRIKVTGNPIYLQQAGIAARVRGFLLAGIRCTLLWRQVGGRRWQFIISKQRMLNDIKTLQAMSRH